MNKKDRVSKRNIDVNRLYEDTKYTVKDKKEGNQILDTIAFLIARDNRINLTTRTRYDGLSLAEFFLICCKSYLDREEEMLQIITKYRKILNKKGSTMLRGDLFKHYVGPKGTPSEKRRQKDYEGRRKKIKEYALSDEEIEDIFDRFDMEDFMNVNPFQRELKDSGTKVDWKEEYELDSPEDGED